MLNPILPNIVYQLTTVSEPSLSPDGKSLAFTRSSIDKTTMANYSQIMLMALPDGDPVPFTRGGKDTAAKYSPDGQTMAFFRRDDKDRRQVWLIAVSGGESRQLTHLRGGISEFAWSPDSTALALVSDVDPDLPPEDHDPKVDPRVRVVRRIRYRADTVGWRGDAHSHLFVVGANDGRSRQLTDGDWDDSSPVWSPDGSRIAFISGRREDRDFVPYTETYVVPAQGGEPVEWSQGLSSIGAITWSPDSKMLAVIGSDDDGIGAAWQSWLFILEQGRAPRRLTHDSIKPATGFAPVLPAPDLRWTGGGRIVFTGDSRGQSYLFEIPAAEGELRTISSGGEQISTVTIDAAGESAVFVSASPTSTGDLHLFDISRGSRRQLTDYNQTYFQEHPPARLEKFNIFRGGVEIECRLLLPPGFESSQMYPMVVDIHGGPHGVFPDTFNPVQQVLATSGYMVLCVNPRGSSTYGVEFAKAVLGDWGGEDYRDIIAGVEEVCSRGNVDSARLGVHGYSYGGFMSSWIVGHDTRFKAAVVGAPCIDLASMYGTSDIGVSFGERQWGGIRKDIEDILRDRSPLTYADSVQAPVLLMHGESDHRCPIEQSEQYFVSLKRMGKEVEFVRFPGSSHFYLRDWHPKLREEYLERALAWFDKYLGSRSVPAPGVTVRQAEI